MHKYLAKKKGETIIGVLVKDFYFYFYNYLVKVEVA